MPMSLLGLPFRFEHTPFQFWTLTWMHRPRVSSRLCLSGRTLLLTQMRMYLLTLPTLLRGCTVLELLVVTTPPDTAKCLLLFWAQ